MSLENSEVFIFLIFRMNFVMRGAREREGTENVERIAKWSDKDGQVKSISEKILDVPRVMRRSRV